MNRRYHHQKKIDKRTNNNLQNITHKTKDRATRTPCVPEGKAVPAPHVVTVM